VVLAAQFGRVAAAANPFWGSWSGQHSGVSTGRLTAPGAPGSIPGFGSLSVWSLHVLPPVSVRGGFLRVLRFPPTVPKMLPVGVDWPVLSCPLVSQDVSVRWIGHQGAI